MKDYSPIEKVDFGSLAEKVDLKPDFFTGFEPARRKEIVTEEAAFYHSITAPFSVDDRLVKAYEDMPGADGVMVPVKTYRPINADKKLPALIFMHGGGFITCSVETHDYVPSYIAANAGVMAFNIEYRLAPEFKFPTGLEDCYAVIKYIVANADKYGIDPEHVCVCGDSSGGNYAAVISMMARDRGDLKIEKQALIYPVTELAGKVPMHSAEVYAPIGGDSDDGEDFLHRYLSDVGTEASLPYVSPLLAADHKNLPEALFIIAECDPLADDGLTYANVLSQAGIKVDYKVYKGMPHAFILRTYTETFDALDRVCAFVKS